MPALPAASVAVVPATPTLSIAEKSASPAGHRRASGDNRVIQAATTAESWKNRVRVAVRSGRRASVVVYRGGARLGAVAFTALALVASAVAAVSASSPSPPVLHGDMIWPAGKKRAPAFGLRDERGAAISLAAERGQVVLLTFMYSRCRQLCPIEGRLLAAAERRLGRSTRSLLLVVSVDPGGDTPATIGRFVGRAGLVGDRWHWLVGSRRQLARVWRAYGIDVQPGGDIGHSGALYLIDRRGYERSGYAVPFLPNLVAADVRALARETG